MKICSKCNTEKPINDFFKKKSAASGYQSACKECKKKWERDYYLNRGGAEKCLAHRIKTKKYQKQTQKEWRKKNQGVKNFHTAKYRALKKEATPKWLTKEQLDSIKNLYKQARFLTEITGINHHVDHIHPLKGDNFRGLHVPWNLQILKEEENLKKNNKLEE